MLKIYNTLTQQKEEFHKKPGESVTMYVCGITPYDKVHLGHARCYVSFDVLRRYLIYRGYQVKHVQNFTDIDDKIIERSRKINKDISQLVEEHISEYFTHLDALGVSRADAYPRVTQHMPAIIDLIRRLVDKKHAYAVEGNVFFDISSFKEYGKLSRRNLDELKEGARIEVDRSKKNPLDFALWKKKKEGEPSWDSPWGEGRPGWHIECSALSLCTLGETIDIHGGGQDLIFPHHENEIAQSECANGTLFVSIWVHNGFVTLNQQKMSKSLGNFFTLEDIFKRYHPMIVRLFLLQQHYRSPLDFSDDRLEETKKSYTHIVDTLSRINTIGMDSHTRRPHPPNQKKMADMEKDFFAALDDDLNTAQAIAQVFSMVNFLNELFGQKQPDVATIALGGFKVVTLLDNVLGLRAEAPSLNPDDEERINQLITARAGARNKRDFAESDRIRDELARMGIALEDTPSGTIWRKT